MADAGKSLQSHSWGLPATVFWNYSPSPPELTKFQEVHEIHSIPAELSKSVTKQNKVPAACHQKRQTCEASARIKGKRFYSGASQSGRMVDSCLKDHLNLPAQAQGSYRDKDGRDFSYPNTFLAFSELGVLHIHLSSFQYAQCKNLPFHHLG